MNKMNLECETAEIEAEIVEDELDDEETDDFDLSFYFRSSSYEYSLCRSCPFGGNGCNACTHDG